MHLPMHVSSALTLEVLELGRVARRAGGAGVLTWHVHHPTVAALEHSLLFTAQPAGRHTIGRVALKLRLPEAALCPAVAPGLGQIGQLQR